MSNQELTTYNFETRIISRPGNVEIVNFDETLNKATLIRDAMKTIVVTEDTVRANKKLLAKLNKAFDAIDTERKRVKREFMEPFSKVDEQCKELKSVVTEATESVRSQIRELEEIERDEKENKIRELWDKRIERMEIKPFLEFERFLTPKHLNKSTSINKVETEMAEYLENEKTAFTALKVFVESNDYDMNDAIALYRKYGSLDTVMIELDKGRREREEAEKVLEQLEERNSYTTEEPDDFFTFYVHAQDKNSVISLLTENGIEVFTD